MKKKLVALLFVGVLSLSLIACGGNSDTTQDTASQATEDTKTVEDTASETENTETVGDEDTTVEASGEQEAAFTLEDGLKKVNTVKAAYNDLTANSADKEIETAVLTDYKNFISGTFSGDDIWIQYASGENLMTSKTELAIGALYMDNYINQGTGYYDFATWLENQDESTMLSHCGLTELSSDRQNSDDLLMVGTFLAAEFLGGCSDISGELVQSSEYTIAGVPSAYVIKLTCDGKTGGTAVFDADGNFLNIVMEENSDFQNAVGATLQ